MLELFDRVVVGTARQALLMNICDGPVRTAHADDLADLGDGG
ncbi:hypothetical protein O974_10400 [Mycobacterium avium 11-0986]|nr:hypothetical protein O974_10400 [Mycobacterium avium 11-0986]